LGSRGEPVAASAAATGASAGDIVITFTVAPFLALPAGLGLSGVSAELPPAAVGIGLAGVVVGATSGCERRRSRS